MNKLIKAPVSVQNHPKFGWVLGGWVAQDQNFAGCWVTGWPTQHPGAPRAPNWVDFSNTGSSTYLRTFPVMVFKSVISSSDALTFFFEIFLALPFSAGAEMKNSFLLPLVLSRYCDSSNVRAETFNGRTSAFGGSGLYQTCSLRALEEKKG